MFLSGFDPLTSVWCSQRVLQRPPWLLQEAAPRDQNRLRTLLKPVVALAAEPANHGAEGGGQGGESGQQLGVKQRLVWNQKKTHSGSARIEPKWPEISIRSTPTHVTRQDIQAGLHQDQSVTDQSTFRAVHVLGALVQVVDHAGGPTDPALTVEPLSAACRHTEPQNLEILGPLLKLDLLENLR